MKNFEKHSDNTIHWYIFLLEQRDVIFNENRPFKSKEIALKLCAP